jgi:DNA-binding transcriptional LysR family regulator
MNLVQLETVLWIARLGSFRAAADKLNSTQPTLSARVKELESDLGIEIFDRSHRQIRLTPMGRLCIECAELVLDATSRLRASLRTGSGLTGRVSIGAVEDVAMIWLPDLLRRITSGYPGLTVDFQIDLTNPLIRKLELGEIDVALIGGDYPLQTGMEAIPLGYVQYVWMAQPGLVPTGATLSPRELQDYPVLTWSEQSAAFPIVRQWFASNGANPKRVNLSNSLTSLASLTMAGLGVSLLPRDLYEAEISRGKLAIVPTSPAYEASPYSAISKTMTWPAAGRVIAELAEAVSTFASSPQQ